MECKCENCFFSLKNYLGEHLYHDDRIKYNKRKAGILLIYIDDNIPYFLLVQSRGRLWGVPKGTIDNNETFLDGAIRELREETNINLSPKEVVNYNRMYINKKVLYFYNITEKGVHTPRVNCSINNDANSVAWISLSCLKHNIFIGNMQITSHTKKILKRLNFFDFTKD
tara:strand:+ start:741 stop:1247 length:507 start_codon:yes stop_codon:yes gene_type:complete